MTERTAAAASAPSAAASASSVVATTPAVAASAPSVVATTPAVAVPKAAAASASSTSSLSPPPVKARRTADAEQPPAAASETSARRTHASVLAYLRMTPFGTEDAATAASFLPIIHGNPCVGYIEYVTTWLALQKKKDAAAAAVAAHVAQAGAGGGMLSTAAELSAYRKRPRCEHDGNADGASALTQLATVATAAALEIAVNGPAGEDAGREECPRPKRATVGRLLHKLFVNIAATAIATRVDAVRTGGGTVNVEELKAQWKVVAVHARDIMPFVVTVVSPPHSLPASWVMAPYATDAECAALVTAGLADMCATDVARLARNGEIVAPTTFAESLTPRFELVVAMLLAADDPLYVESVSGIRRHIEEIARMRFANALQVCARARVATAAAACARAQNGGFSNAIVDCIEALLTRGRRVRYARGDRACADVRAHRTSTGRI